ncbi:MAG: YARHG domain-containing protein [Bacteroidales bacterium]|nr:YARHG domain-containing protein [Bacteroidales bacterium]
MKKTAIILTLLAAISIQAQTIKNGTSWYSGWTNFKATAKAGGKMLMAAMEEGQEVEFTLTPVKGKIGEYTVSDGITDGAVNPYEKTKKAVLKSRDGLEALCFYTANGGLLAVLAKVGSNDQPTDLATQQWIQQNIGTYSSADGNTTLEWKTNIMVANDISAHYTVETFNGQINGAINIKGGTLDGLWIVEPNLKGMTLHSAKYDEYGMLERTGIHKTFIESDPLTGRFAFATRTLLNDKWFTQFDNATLRIMRNEIMAHHGYKFNSKDMQQYFESEDWYKAQPNTKIKLTLVEELNTELIKYVESNPENNAD